VANTTGILNARKQHLTHD